MMKNLKYLLFAFVALFALNISVKAVTSPKLFVTNKDNYIVGSKRSNYDLDKNYIL